MAYTLSWRAETAETLNTSPQPSRYVRKKGAAPLTVPHAPSAPVRSTPAYFLCKWEYILD